MDLRDKLRLMRAVGQLPSGFLDSARHVDLSFNVAPDEVGDLTNASLVDVLLDAVRVTQTIDLSTVVSRCRTQELADYVRTWPGEHYRLLPALASVVGAKHVVEIGTSLGLSALALRQTAPLVTTYDLVPWDTFPDTALVAEDFDHGISQRIGNLADPQFFKQELPRLMDADLIFVDATKDGVFEPAFISMLYPEILGTGKLVVWDDIRVLHMIDVWRRLRVPKLDATTFGHWTGTGLTLSL